VSNVITLKAPPPAPRPPEPSRPRKTKFDPAASQIFDAQRQKVFADHADGIISEAEMKTRIATIDVATRQACGAA
jgi:hypothetical protein